MQRLSDVLSAIARAGVSSKEQRRLGAAAVCQALRPDEAAPRADHSDGIGQMAMALRAVEGKLDSPPMGISEAKSRLRQLGEEGVSLASRLGSLSKARNWSAHPEKLRQLLQDIAALEPASGPSSAAADGEVTTPELFDLLSCDGDGELQEAPVQGHLVYSEPGADNPGLALELPDFHDLSIAFMRLHDAVQSIPDEVAIPPDADLQYQADAFTPVDFDDCSYEHCIRHARDLCAVATLRAQHWTDSLTNLIPEAEPDLNLIVDQLEIADWVALDLLHADFSIFLDAGSLEEGLRGEFGLNPHDLLPAALWVQCTREFDVHPWRGTPRTLLADDLDAHNSQDGQWKQATSRKGKKKP